MAEAGSVDWWWRNRSARMCRVGMGFQRGSLCVPALIPGSAGEDKAEALEMGEREVGFWNSQLL